MRSFPYATGLVLVLFSLLQLAACDNVDNNADPLGIGFSDPRTATTASGSLDQQNAGPKVTYTVAKASVFPTANGIYVLRYNFTSNDSMDLVVVRRTTDYNYHSDNQVAKNSLAQVIFNRDTLQLNASAVAIQPLTDQNRFSTVVNVHTVEKGDFNGTVIGVPLVH
jgi:hypothetical protein